MNWGAWWAAVHGVSGSQTWLRDFTFTFHFPALEKEMATQSSVLAWRIPGMEEPGELPSMGSHRVRHNWGILAAAAAEQPRCPPASERISKMWYIHTMNCYSAIKGAKYWFMLQCGWISYAFFIVFIELDLKCYKLYVSTFMTSRKRQYYRNGK